MVCLPEELKHKLEEIVVKLGHVGCFVVARPIVGEAVRTIGVKQFTYYRWRKEAGGLKAIG